MKTLDEIVILLNNFDGISRKYVLPGILSKLRESSFNGNQPHSLGEDSAAIKTESDEVILLTTDAIVEQLCLAHPRSAGFNAVLANVMDIYAAGGVPTSFAVALSYSDPKVGEMLLQGLIDGSHTFRIPVTRGHTNPQSESTYVVGSATGTVKRDHLLTAGGAQSGDSLVLLFDQSGKRGSSYKLGWDSVTDRSSDDVVGRLSTMNELAENGILNAAKDVSVAGIIGTAGMMLEFSGMGGVVEIDQIDLARPKQISLDDWLRMFISLGFLVSLDPTHLSQLSQIAEDHGMTAIRIGQVDDISSLRLRWGSDERVMFDFSKGPLLTPRGTP
ncbi:MAG: AIR synthase-related protein [Candidatus Thorarchaeota archaeon]